MSAFQMLDMCVNYIARRHHMLTDDHVAILDDVWGLYESPELPMLPPSPPPSPPPERQHLRFDKEEWPCNGCIDQEVWKCGQCISPEEAQEKHQGDCDCSTCEYDELAQEDFPASQQHERERMWQEQEQEQERVPRCSDYLYSCDTDRCTYECGAACGSSPAPEPVINLTCDKVRCSYGCDCYDVPSGSLYQLPAVVSSTIQAAIESDDDMPPLISLARSTPKGWYNPEEDTEDETEIVNSAPPPPSKPPKAKSIFPYNHPRWPSPRAKALVDWMIRRGRTSKGAIRYALKGELGEPIKGLTHDVCMRYLAKYHNLTHEQLLEKSIYLLHNPNKNTPYWHVCPCPFCKGGYSRGYNRGY